MFPVSWFVVIVFWMSAVLCEICDDANHDFTNKEANDSFGSFFNSIDNIVEASDPLRIDLIEDKQPTISYKLTNAIFSGMKDCGATNLKIDEESLSFLFNLKCSHIVTNADYEVKGNILALYVEGKGMLTITADDYVFIFNCKYERTTDEDNKTYVQIISHNFDTEAKGKVLLDATNLFGGDKEKSDVVIKFINDNWKTVENLFRKPTLDNFMELFIRNLNSLLKTMSVENVPTGK